jgi:glyoxylase-like metal-dependent hydrolase (beta-lactamase superfamily II)
VLFKHSIGRTDLPGGSLLILLKSIREQLYVLPAATKVYSGHFETTTIGEEMQNNPYTR